MNLPNKITVFRFCCIPFLWLFSLWQFRYHWVVALLVYFVACVSDTVDGNIARKKKLVTDFGKLMDPLADKLMVMAALVCFAYAKIVHPAVVIIILAREFLVTGLRMLAVTEGKVIAADIWGKLKTTSQDIGIILILLWKSLEQAAFAPVLKTASTVFVWIMTVLTVISAVNYCVKNIGIFKETK